jgi:hypothetical protein
MTYYSYFQAPKASTNEQYGIDHLEGAYKGLKWRKDAEYTLYYLLAVPDKELPASLSFKFTKPTLLFSAIDEWIEHNAHLNFPDKK